ncbi:MAG: tryptophan-rich sensory protein, partial [Candidatus Saccharicenans sp.]|nr:tryptophan-rich sensory protein [Candidatus Saccharicenans sp.]
GREVFPAFKRLGGLFFLTCLANAGWIFAWHYEQLILSLLVMIGLLVLLVIIYLRLGGRSFEEKQHDRFPALLPFSFYLAWISVATVANTTAVLVGYGWGGFGLSPQFWTVSVLALILILTLIFILKKKDLLYGLTIIWALFGILYKRIQDTAAADRAVEIAVIAGLALILLSLILRVIAHPRKSSLT